jgi:hypothetical protein
VADVGAEAADHGNIVALLGSGKAMLKIKIEAIKDKVFLPLIRNVQVIEWTRL